MADYSRAFGYWTYAAFICTGLYDVVRQGVEFIRWLIIIGASFSEQIHLIGLSLGGQMVGLNGAELSKDPATTVARVTGNVLPYICKRKIASRRLLFLRM